MGLHTTPYGSFYVQRDLKTGEIIQVLPVEPSDTPDQLPSVGALGIDKNFIESRRATFEANSVRASDSQGRLQRELATVGGRRLLETGRAVIAQRGDGGDVDMAYNHAPAPAAATQSQPRYTSSHQDHRGGSSSSSLQHYTTTTATTATTATTSISQDLHSPSSHMHSVRPWPESLTHEHVVTRAPLLPPLPPPLPMQLPLQTFRGSIAAATPSHEDEVHRHDERGGSSSSNRGGSTTTTTTTSRSQRCRSTSTAISISSMVTDSEGGSGGSTASTSEACTPHPDYDDCGVTVEPTTTTTTTTTMADDAHATKTKKTVWITWTLEPRRAGSGGGCGSGSDCEYGPQRVRTHMETHVLN